MGKKQPRRVKHVPERTCVICRQKKDKRQLVRLVRTPEAGVVIDPTGKQNGRGAYLCANSECWQQALTNIHKLNQALKTNLGKAELEIIAAHKPVSTGR